MRKIKQLPKEIVGKIAAGEVVERPANIVKELIENSIDANAESINVIISNGGLDSVLVKDDGEGILQEEIKFAFELHTTSKLDSDQIQSVNTLGFRGEALASIAAISRIECITKSSQDELGTKIILEGGKLKNSEELSTKQGTQLKISGIFFNTPARRKFLKSARTERKRISDIIINYCLMYPEIHFKLEEITKSGTEKLRIESPERTSLLSVIYDVLGSNIASDLIRIDRELDDWNISGYISKPVLTRSDRSLQYIAVNGRPIKHQDLQSSIEDAYGSQLMRREHPVVILKLDGPNEAVDFNVHPQKSEIRFKTDDPIIDTIRNIVLEALEENTELPNLKMEKLKRIKTKTKKSNIDEITSTKEIRTDVPNTVNEQINAKGAKQSKIKSKGVNYVQSSLFNTKAVQTHQGFSILGHVMNKFALIEKDNELWLIDVHAADERVKFEMFEKSRERKPVSQQFLEPLSIELPESEKQLLLDNKKDLNKFGMKISNAGSKSILVHSIPVYYDQDISKERISNMVKDMIGYFNKSDEYGAVETPLDMLEYGIVSRLACHGAIRSGYKVSHHKIASVIKELLKCKFPWTCAHGRPTVLRLSKTKLENWFKR